MPKVSVIVPVYNVEKYVEKCAKSVLSQTEPDLELILVDDGSTDKSGEICEEIAKDDARARVIHQKNQGLGGARNTGVEACRGEWILFLDSDDWIPPKALRTALLTAATQNAEMVVQAFQTVDEEGKVLAEFREELPESQTLSLDKDRELMFIAPCAWAKLYKASLFRDSGIRYPPRAWYEDLRTTLKLLPRAKGVAVSHEIGCNYLQRAGSIMNSADLGRSAEIMEAIEDLVDWYKAQGLFEKYRDELEYLAVYHVYVTASVRVLRVDWKNPLLGEFARFMREKFPAYQKNPYLKRLGAKRRLIFRLLEMRMAWALALLFKAKR